MKANNNRETKITNNYYCDKQITQKTKKQMKQVNFEKSRLELKRYAIQLNIPIARSVFGAYSVCGWHVSILNMFNLFISTQANSMFYDETIGEQKIALILIKIILKHNGVRNSRYMKQHYVKNRPFASDGHVVQTQPH